MVTPLLVFLIAVPVGIQLLLAAFVHYDAGDIGMNARKWAAIVGGIPIAGLAIYLLARSEHFYDPADDPFREHTHEIHPSRRDEPVDPAATQSGTDRGSDGDATSSAARQADSGDAADDHRDNS
ncbi:hypothetical protein Halru_3070 [Halovivax ruber XH-70]|uniref:Cardiolipin synthase N-terminal domain-containing protein n=1 Tax=Halovivax ruber (strain DSM 18193 / JCM 13892 / XH-70) TaxID=797302 RepID=L0IHB4_HALRX|nr:hypothetical protein [Halovivax ruber]AGB17636.1 hypothetical protein Halru_3070 [Halovivax ruber XH-70]